MTLFRVTAVSLSLAFIVGAPERAESQPNRDRAERARPLFTWSGVVDREVILALDGNRVVVRGERGIPASRGAGVRTVGVVPRLPGDVRVRLLDGRGSVDVIQQPSARNNFTTLIRIRDGRGGTDRYRISAVWEPDDRNGRNDNDDWYRGRDDDRRGDKDRGDARDNGRDNGRGNGPGNGQGNGRGNDAFNSGLQWSGVVDDVVDLRISGRRVQVIERSGARTYNVHSTVTGPGLSRPGDVVKLVQADGRGNVVVLQQPAPWNDFTAVVRIHDPRGGAGRYSLALRW